VSTKDLIKDKGRKLFNRQGVQNVTLRDIAAGIKKSYGNVTYHFPNKEVLVSQLYDDMLIELNEISEQMTEQKDVFSAILKAPEFTFELTIKYIFIFKDLTEIRRTFPDLAKRIDQSNRTRKEALIGVLQFLQAQEILRQDLDDQDLDYLMELSGAMRTMFFIQHDVSVKPSAAVKAKYVEYVNRLLKPYLAEGYTI
jgi:AcrR family transcriptional regulator